MLIEAKGIKKYYKKVRAVDGIDLEVRQGEILGILGPNGAGKSTAISVISSLIKPDGGDVFFKGESILKNPAVIRKVMGIVPQEVAIYPDLSAAENLKFFGKLYGLRGDMLQKRIQEVLDLLGLNGRAKDAVKNYSGGMKRRVNIGAALLHHPEILIMDEPTVGIDPQSRNHILETVKELNKKGMTIIYTSHYMEEVEHLCHRIYVMDHGKVIASGTKEDLKNLMGGDDIVSLLTDRASESFLKELRGNLKVKNADQRDGSITLMVEKDCDILSDIFEAASKSGIKLKSLDVKTPTLEDVFLYLTGRGLRD
ncbi:MAG: ABC transporter ATP-binding protein [Bacillota bacterium]|nr:ABC transporter ATP-binding protein [Bacillota bacterium]MDD3850937.1 ABC transporter ATP-binding protein [Bacillota bacterium]